MHTSDVVVVYKNRTNVLRISMGQDISADTITSEIRTQDGVLICTWTPTFDSDGTDGELVLTLDNSAVSAITYMTGLMDLKRVRGGEPYAVFAKPLEVEFRNSVTA